MEIRQILREASRRNAADLDSGKREAVTGRPDKVARKLLIWTPELDLQILEATPEDLLRLGQALDASPDRLRRRRRAVLASINQEILT